MCWAPRWCGRGLGMGAFLPPDGLCAPPGFFFLLRGPCNARGPWVSWTGSQCGPAGFVTSGAFLLPGVWACCVWVDMAAAVAPFIFAFLSLILMLSSLRLCPPTELTSLLCCHFQILFLTRFLLSGFKGLSHSFDVYLNDSLTTDWTFHSCFPSLLV